MLVLRCFDALRRIRGRSGLGTHGCLELHLCGAPQRPSESLFPHLSTLLLLLLLPSTPESLYTGTPDAPGWLPQPGTLNQEFGKTLRGRVVTFSSLVVVISHRISPSMSFSSSNLQGRQQQPGGSSCSPDTACRCPSCFQTCTADSPQIARPAGCPTASGVWLLHLMRSFLLLLANRATAAAQR